MHLLSPTDDHLECQFQQNALFKSDAQGDGTQEISYLAFKGARLYWTFQVREYWRCENYKSANLNGDMVITKYLFNQ